MRKNAIINSILNVKALKLGKLMALMPLPVSAILPCTVLVVHTHLKKEWTQSTQQTQYRTLAQALWVISKGTTLSSNLSDFFLTWRMLSKILESKNEEPPMLQVYSHHCSPPQDRTLSKGANIPEKDSRQRLAYRTSARSSVIEEKYRESLSERSVGVHGWLTRDSYALC